MPLRNMLAIVAVFGWTGCAPADSRSSPEPSVTPDPVSPVELSTPAVERASEQQPAVTHPIETPPERPEAAASAAPVEAEAPAEQPQPASTGVIRQLLQARHSQDLPTRAVLDQHQEAELALHWLTLNDDMSMIRSRAAERLGHYPSSEGLLIIVLNDTEQPDNVRAGALRGLARLELQGSSLALAAILEQVSSPSMRLGLEAVVALREVPAAAAELEKLAEDPAVLESVRARIAAE